MAHGIVGCAHRLVLCRPDVFNPQGFKGSNLSPKACTYRPELHILRSRGRMVASRYESCCCERRTLSILVPDSSTRRSCSCSRVRVMNSPGVSTAASSHKGTWKSSRSVRLTAPDPERHTELHRSSLVLPFNERGRLRLTRREWLHAVCTL